MCKYNKEDAALLSASAGVGSVSAGGLTSGPDDGSAKGTQDQEAPAPYTPMPLAEYMARLTILFSLPRALGEIGVIGDFFGLAEELDPSVVGEDVIDAQVRDAYFTGATDDGLSVTVRVANIKQPGPQGEVLHGLGPDITITRQYTAVIWSWDAGTIGVKEALDEARSKIAAEAQAVKTLRRSRCGMFRPAGY